MVTVVVAITLGETRDMSEDVISKTILLHEPELKVVADVPVKPPVVLTEALGQEVLDELAVIANVQHAVDAGIHQLLLLVAQILADVLRDEHYVALHVDHEEEAVKGLRRKDEMVNILRK